MKKIFVFLTIGIVLLGCEKSNSNNVQDSTQASVSLPKVRPTSNWNYSESKDEMRNIRTNFASINSDNEVNFNAPYNGGSHLIIKLRQQPSITEIMFVINKGQYSCEMISNSEYCYASVKFDNNSIKTFSLTHTVDRSNDILFMENQKDVDKFIQSLLKSKSLIIELPFYREGKKQFKFSPSGLKLTKYSLAEEQHVSDLIVSEAIQAASEATEAAANY